ncbi:hypothetical protein CSC74_08140 [Pseudoxanthomonas yeongjuensis]|nr:hypothetical protein CSC74_08140 [Pseudoxanthomonas yeongjuensis]
MDLLFVLAAHAGQVVTREQLMTRLWPGLVVGEDSLARTVSKLRQSLGDDAKAPRYIETIAKRGYRLRVQVEAATQPPTGVTADQPLPHATRRDRWWSCWAWWRCWCWPGRVSATGQSPRPRPQAMRATSWSRVPTTTISSSRVRTTSRPSSCTSAYSACIRTMRLRWPGLPMRWLSGPSAGRSRCKGKARNSPGLETRSLPGICNANPPVSNCSVPGNWPSAPWRWHPIPQRRTRRWVSY